MTTYAELRQAHAKGYGSTADEAWDREAICLTDGHAWPCDTTKALDLVETMRGDVHHHVNPYLGLLRYDFEQSTGIDPLTIVNDDTGLPDVTDVAIPFVIGPSLVVSTVHALQAATDAADAALGEKPMREQIADLQAQLATRNTPTHNENGPNA